MTSEVTWHTRFRRYASILIYSLCGFNNLIKQVWAARRFLTVCSYMTYTLFILRSHLRKLLWIRQQVFQGQVSFTVSSVLIYYDIKSCSISAAVIYYCWKLWVRKSWIECEVNRRVEFSVESNMPPKKKMKTEDTHLVWTDYEVQLY